MKADFDYAGRIERLRRVMEESGVEVVLLSVGSDLPYLIGYEAKPSERLTMLAMTLDSKPRLLVPRLEMPKVQPGPFELAAWSETQDPVALVAGLVGDAQQVAVGDHTWSIFLMALQSLLPNRSWRGASALTGTLRLRKDRAEIEALRSAAHAVDQVMERVPDEVRFSGRTESDVARDLARLIVEEGHDVSAHTIIASGPNGASPHHEPGDRLIETGDLVVCDIGGRVDGYFSDCTRTFAVGPASDSQIAVHGAVLASNEAGRAAVRPGVACEDIDRAARKVIVDAGFGDYFVHRTGHGIGLEVHEHPYMVEGNREVLASGMTFSVEPGVYLPGEYGVRIEDIVVVSDDGVESLNQSERGLVAVS